MDAITQLTLAAMNQPNEPTIQIDGGIGTITLTQQEVQKMYHDISFLEQALAATINPTAMDNTDYCDFMAKDYEEHIKDYFTENETEHAANLILEGAFQ